MKTMLMTVLICIAATSLFAQKGNNQVAVGVETAFPTGTFGEEFKTGFGGWLKFRHGIGANGGQITFTTGYTSFTAKGSGSQGSASIGILPLLVGFQYTTKAGFYIEPQLGYGSYHASVNVGGQSASGSRGAFTYAAGIGFMVSDFDIGLRYQNARIEGEDFSNVAFRLGYSFKLKK